MTWKNKRLLGLHHLTSTMCHLTPAINFISVYKTIRKKNDKPKNTQNTIFNMSICVSLPLGVCNLVCFVFFVSWFFGVGGVGWSLREETLQRWREIAIYLRRKCCKLRTPTVACSDIKPVNYDYTWLVGLKIHPSGEMFLWQFYGIVKNIPQFYIPNPFPRRGVRNWPRHPISGHWQVRFFWNASSSTLRKLVIARYGQKKQRNLRNLWLIYFHSCSIQMQIHAYKSAMNL